MGAFQEKWQGSRYILGFLILNLFCWFFGIAVAQEIDALAKAIDSLNFPLEAITCIVNLLVFGVTLIRGRLDLENGTREVLGILRDPKLCKINGTNGMGVTTINIEEQNHDSAEGGRCLESATRSIQEQNRDSTKGARCLHTASVVMLSNGAPNASMKQFMKSNAVDDVQSIVLQYLRLNDAMNGLEGAISECSRDGHRCNCIVFCTVEKITIILAGRMPGTLKSVSNSMCLLPCLNCLNKSCHGCNHGLLHVERTDQTERLEERDSRGESPAVVCELLDETALRSDDPGEPICICIPAHNAGDDKWTEVLTRSFNSKDAEDRGVRVPASEALQDYLDEERRRGKKREELKYSIGSFIGPRLSEILINIFLTFWFKVDGFSSSFLARRSIRNYLVDSKGNRLAANAFLTKATVLFDHDADNKHVFQVLTFRGNGLSFITLSSIMAGVNLICFIGWVVLIAFDCGDSAPPLTLARVLVIIAAISIACIMDGLYMYTNKVFFQNPLDYRVLLVIIWEIVCVVAGIVVAQSGVVRLNWVYSALQLLVWVKWVIGSYILDEYARESSGYRNDDWKVLIFSSAFLLNAVLAGVRIKWTPTWPWKKNQLFRHFFANESHNAFDPTLAQC